MASDTEIPRAGGPLGASRTSCTESEGNKMVWGASHLGHLLEIGGIMYTAAPFNGWYMGTEIGARNLADEGRYNKLPLIAKLMGQDTSSETTLWRDRALVELNRRPLFL